MTLAIFLGCNKPGLQLYQTTQQATSAPASSAQILLRPVPVFGYQVLIEITVESLLVLAFLFCLVIAFGTALQRLSA